MHMDLFVFSPFSSWQHNFKNRELVNDTTNADAIETFKKVLKILFMS